MMFPIATRAHTLRPRILFAGRDRLQQASKQTSKSKQASSGGLTSCRSSRLASSTYATTSTPSSTCSLSTCIWACVARSNNNTRTIQVGHLITANDQHVGHLGLRACVAAAAPAQGVPSDMMCSVMFSCTRPHQARFQVRRRARPPPSKAKVSARCATPSRQPRCPTYTQRGAQRTAADEIRKVLHPHSPPTHLHHHAHVLPALLQQPELVIGRGRPHLWPRVGNIHMEINHTSTQKIDARQHLPGHTGNKTLEQIIQTSTSTN